MLSILGAIFLVSGFVVFITLFNLVGKSRRVFQLSKNALAVVRDPGMSDEEKEKAMQQSSKDLFALFFLILFICSVAIFVPFGVLWLLDKTGLLSVHSVIDRTLSWQFILGSSVVILIAMWIKRKK